MAAHRKFATIVTAAAVMLTSPTVNAADIYSFPSSGGALIAASKPAFEQSQVRVISDTGALSPSLGGPSLGGLSMTAGAGSASLPPPLAVSPDYLERFGARSRGVDAYSYRMLTHALTSASFANYAADYYRLFTPGLAVSTWTDRVSTGLVEVGYGSAVDGWTAGAYYLARLHGPARRRESPADLSVMPTFRAHPELQQNPTFTQPGN